MRAQNNIDFLDTFSFGQPCPGSVMANKRLYCKNVCEEHVSKKQRIIKTVSSKKQTNLPTSTETVPVKIGLPPIIASKDSSYPPPLLLILGSAPSEMSLKKQQYYGHPQNHFWGITGCLFDYDSTANYSDRCAALRQRRIAVWDVARVFVRKGSADSELRGAGKQKQAASIFKRFIIDRGLVPTNVEILPTLTSSSPANAMKDAVVVKTEKWRRVFGSEFISQLLDNAKTQSDNQGKCDMESEEKSLNEDLINTKT
eukprot:224347_1